MTEEDRIKDRAGSEQEDEAQAFQQARELVLALANTISALKIFPAHHSSAIHFRQDFISRLKAFLERYQKLELEVGEFAFYYQGKPVYQDEISSKSLPFFFYKDGLRVLALYQGMDEQEIGEFLELVRSESAKPAEESDLVNALWLKDLANVQYYAPEEFIENRILEERAESLNKKGLQIIPQELANRVVEINVDRQKIFSGQVELRQEEKQALESFQDQEFPDLPETWQQTLSFAEGEAKPEEIPGQEKAPGSLPEKVALNREELNTLNQLIERNRQLLPEEEFVNLMMEILALEKDLEQYRANLEILKAFYQESIKAGRFEIPILLDRKIKDLKALISQDQPEKMPLLESFADATSSLQILDEVRKLVDQKVELNYQALFEYVKQFGDKALPFLAEFYEKIDNPEFRSSLRQLIRSKLQENPATAAAFIDDQKPELTAEVIELMRELPGQKIISQFSNFLTLSRRELKLQAIEALSSFQEDLANKILLGFMNDSDGQVRLKATSSLRYLGDPSRLKQLVKDTGTRAFRHKPFEEKKALFEFLGRSRNPEAFNFLKKTYLKKSILPATTELRVCAVAGLEANRSPEALELLRRGEKFLNPRVRQAASQALVRLTLGQPPQLEENSK
ncbi:MAG: HEAT repeat domain-containing protein [Candidatus Aminicenantes bacterium]|nr:HEAT repeat domain-containing protein [Candidatus Aminicenantes bacterium]